MSATHYKNGQLHMEDVALERIAAEFGTPVYCYSAAGLAENFLAYLAALRHIAPEERFTLCYAAKANSNQAVLRLLAKLGSGADVVSGGELTRALQAGIPAGKIVFSGVGKTEAEITLALQAGILQLNVESESEMQLISAVAKKLGVTARIAFRVNPDVDARTHAKITTGTSENKFGIDIDAAPTLYRKARAAGGLDPAGVAVHIGSQLTDLDPYREAFTRVAALVETLRADGTEITTVDVGGGLGITYKDETPPDLNAYAALLRDILLPLGVRLVLEPGRSIAGDTGVLLTRVAHVKHGRDKKFIIIDAAMNDLIRPSLYDAYHAILPCREAAGAPETCDIVGPVCESSDTFLTDIAFPAAVRGDLLAIMTAGAYGAVMSGTYNTRPLVPEVLVSGTRADLIRKTRTVQDIISDDSVPSWLQ